MSNYVWAVHDFFPEHEDEIDFHAGDRIEILERDDLYSDGWWQGRNPAGKSGLFPQSYTSPTQPDAPLSATTRTPTGGSALQPLEETEEPVEENDQKENDSAVMAATMTDVQAAIDQLDQRSEARSFSFVSSKDGSDDHLSESDGENENDDSWRVDARRALAERAMREMQRREQLDAADAPVRASLPPIDAEYSDESDAEDDHERAHVSDGTPRTANFPPQPHPPVAQQPVVAPPIPVEPPREPTPEPPQLPPRLRTPSPPPVAPVAAPPVKQVEQPTPAPAPAQLSTLAPVSVMSSHSRDASALSLPTPNSEASHSAHGSISSHGPSAPPIQIAPSAPSVPSAITLAAALPLPASPAPEEPTSMRTSLRSSGGAYAALQTKPSLPGSGRTSRTHSYSNSTIPPERSYTPVERLYSELPSTLQHQSSARPLDLRTSTEIVAASLPSPAASSFDARTGPRYSTTTTSSAPRTSTAITSPQSSLFNNPNSGVHPSEWSVDQVIAWLRARGFDDGVCDKFAEHEISGDVLLELDATILKDEIGIVQFGKRMRIANAIQELQRPPSIVSSDNSGSRQQQQHPHAHHQGSSTHSRTMNGSVTGTSPLVTSILSPESPPHSGDIYTPDRRSEPGSAMMPHGAVAIPMPHPQPYPHPHAPIVGLGYGYGHARTTSNASSQPSQVAGIVGNGIDRSDSLRSGYSLGVRQPNALNLSPSDGALNKRAALADQILEEFGEERVHDERAVMSEGETADGLEKRAAKKRQPTDDEVPAAQFQFDAPGQRKTRASVDVPPSRTSPTKATHDGSRLSFFGGKSRKPPPRVGSTEVAATLATEDTESAPAPVPAAPARTLSRLHFGSSSKARPPSRADTSPTHPGVAPSIQPSATLRKRTMSAGDSNASSRGKINLKPGMSIVDQIGEADYSGWMRKRGERYNTWKLRYFVLKGPHLYYLRSRNETKLKGYINIVGYKVIADENANPGRYGFRVIHETDKPHYFSSEEQMIVREWMKAIMKATIDRDYTRPVISSCNIPTIPLTIAQAMNPAPRPPSPGQRDATQRAMRRDNPNQLSSRDARVLMGLPAGTDNTQPPPPHSPTEHSRHDSFFSVNSGSTGRASSPPVSPSTTSPTRPKRRTRTSVDPSQQQQQQQQQATSVAPIAAEDEDLIRWINSHLPAELHVADVTQSLSTGLVLFRLAEAIKGRSAGVPDSVFPRGPNDDRLEGLFKLFDFLLDNDIRTGSVSINDVRQGRKDKLVQLLKTLKGWEDKRLAIAKSVGVGAVVAGPWAS
ncbi:hypothetical protein BKA62DRAFT_682246 [Auriculariales sp. MPI-PUGE-AT-0066]|nr:hypothetical protein BKA62DRAFT_682246 [Auriculariales sp. MPI-PUGE-AT-0066]